MRNLLIITLVYPNNRYYNYNRIAVHNRVYREPVYILCFYVKKGFISKYSKTVPKLYNRIQV